MRKNNRVKNKLTEAFGHISSSDTALAGGKGASLGEMTQADIPVPLGFVILATAFEKFLEETDLNVEIDSILHSVNHKEMHTIEDASERINALITEAEMPQNIADEIQKFFKKLGAKYVAVRSSATAEDSASAAWAGQLESYLNTTEENLLENVKRCWASLFAPRAIFYRFEKALHKQKISVAVVVQKMVESEKSGIAFSVHPVTQDKNQMIIEAGYGLGEAIVSGQITPDSYVVEKRPRRIIDKNVQTQTKGLYLSKKGGNEWRDIPREKGEKQVLSDEEIFALSEILIRIENHYGFPVDIEWAEEKGKFYIVQSRPITTLEKGSVSTTKDWRAELGFTEAEWQFEFQQRNAHPVIMADLWLRTLRDYLARELKIEIKAPDYLFTGTNKGYIKSKDKEEILKRFAKKIREDKNYLQYVFEKTMQAMEELEDIVDFILDSPKDDPAELLKLWDEYEKKILEVIPWFYIPWYLTEENVLSDRVKQGLKKYQKAVEQITDFNNALGALLFPVKEADFQREQRSFYGLVKFAEENSDYKDSPKFKDKAEQYLREYGWMKTFLLLPIEPLSYQGLILKIEDALDNNSLEEYALQQKKKQENENLTKRLKEMMAKDENLMKNIELAQELGWLLTASVEKALYAHYKILPFFKKLASALGVEYQDWVHLRSEEIKQPLSGKPQVDFEKISERKISYVAIMIDSKIRWFFGKEAKEMTDYIDAHIGAVDEDIESFSGQPAYPGKVTGEVYIALSPKEAAKIQEGQILVTSMTSPDYVPAMKKAAAIITDEGGLLSHAAIVSRELGKPCIVGTKIATKILKNGYKIEIDADAGSITILKKGE